MTGLNVAGGIAAGRIVSRLIPTTTSPLLRIAAPLAGAIAVKKFVKGKSSDALAAGMVASSVLDAVSTFAPGLASGAGVAGLGGSTPYKSLTFPGVAGTQHANHKNVELRMQ